VKAIRALPGEIESAGHVVNAADRAEMAVPSYTHWNPLIRWLFWKRLDVAVDLAGLRPGIRVLDFGVGTGVLARTLASADASRIVGVDVLLGPAEEMARRTGISVELLPAGELEKRAHGASFSQAHPVISLQSVAP
jgi:2-polyprenyl-3-methyl-5-hydroxy-6-metoxy-1,4-benzoquinol methylase